MKRSYSRSLRFACFSACSLDETPYGFYSSDNFYKTEEDAESGLMYAYNALNYLEYLRGIWYLGDIPTETMYPKSDEPGDIHMLQQWPYQFGNRTDDVLLQILLHRHQPRQYGHRPRFGRQSERDGEKTAWSARPCF